MRRGKEAERERRVCRKEEAEKWEKRVEGKREKGRKGYWGEKRQK